MDAKEFLTEEARMFSALGATKGATDESCLEIRCASCPLKIGTRCVKDTIDAVDIVERWSKSHQNTFLAVLKKAFPDTPLDGTGTPPQFCPKDIGLVSRMECRCNCAECWNQEVGQSESEATEK